MLESDMVGYASEAREGSADGGETPLQASSNTVIRFPRYDAENMDAPVENSPTAFPVTFVPSARMVPSERDHTAAEVVALSQSIDQEVRGGRLRSALDLTLAAESIAPATHALYVRQAELLLALGDTREAADLHRRIVRIMELAGTDELQIEIGRLSLHLSPSPDAATRFAEDLLAAGRSDLIDTYLPAAIDLVVPTDPAKAYQLARAWHAFTPASFEACLTLTALLLSDGQPDEAIDAARKLHEQAPTDPRTSLLLLATLAVIDDAEQWAYAAQIGEAIHRKALDPTDALAILDRLSGRLIATGTLPLYRAAILLERDDPDAAISALDELRVEDANGPAVYAASLLAANAWLVNGDTGRAATAFEQALTAMRDIDHMHQRAMIDLVPTMFDVVALCERLAQSLIEVHDARRALSLVEATRMAYPADRALDRTYAATLAATGNRAEAISRLTDLLREQVTANDRDGALETMETMIRLAPGNMRVRSRYTEELLARGRVEEAYEELREQARLFTRARRNRDAVQRLQRAAQIGAFLNRWDEVAGDYLRMIQLNPNDVDLRHSAVTAFVEHGWTSAAIEQLQEITRISIARHDVDSAVAALHQTIALAPTDTTSYHKLAEILASIGEYGQAERVYQRLRTLAPDDPSVEAKLAAVAGIAREQGRRVGDQQSGRPETA